MIRAVTGLFPLWALTAGAIALAAPALFTPLKPAVVPLLGVVMFGMGMTLTPANFRTVLSRPTTVLLGTGAQFLVMPLLAWIIASALQLPPQTAAGLILVGSCPGGTASNVVTYLARGDVALSITLTTVSTLLAIAATPLLTWLYVGQGIPVPIESMLLGILQMVLLPVLAGVLVNTCLGDRLHAVKRVFPALSVAAICVIIAIVVALNRDQLQVLALATVIAVALHNLLGLAAGYGLARAIGLEPRLRRTLAIEVGMQNSGLGVALAVTYFSPAAALPGAVFSVWHNLTGSLLAALWSRRPTTPPVRTHP